MQLAPPPESRPTVIPVPVEEVPVHRETSELLSRMPLPQGHVEDLEQEEEEEKKGLPPKPPMFPRLNRDKMNPRHKYNDVQE
jgi:hypothetical protein